MVVQKKNEEEWDHVLVYLLAMHFEGSIGMCSNKTGQSGCWCDIVAIEVIVWWFYGLGVFPGSHSGSCLYVGACMRLKVCNILFPFSVERLLI